MTADDKEFGQNTDATRQSCTD